MYPNHARKIVSDSNILNEETLVSILKSQGYDKIHIVKFGKKSKECNETVKHYSCGPSINESSIDKIIQEGNISSFYEKLPQIFSKKVELFNELRKVRGLDEIFENRPHIQLPPLDEKREKYVSGNLFSEGDDVIIESTQETGFISFCGSNYVIVEKDKGGHGRFWLKNVKLIERKVAQDDDIEDREGTQPKKYYSGLKTKSTKQSRARHFEKGENLDDDDPKAYEPAPGDATAKTKPSKYTKKYDQMFKEKVEYFTMSELKKQLKKDYGSNASSLKIVKIKGGVSIQTPSGQELERYNNVPKLGYTIVGEENIQEGVHDPAIFKAIFMAGGPGSGKSYVANNTGLTALGFRTVNSDDKFEYMLKKANLTTSPEDIWSEKGQTIRPKAKAKTDLQQDVWIDGRLGLLIDGTGKDFNKIQKQADKLKKLGYDVAMIFVNTNLQTAIDRDENRSRSLGKEMVTKMWNEVQDNIGHFQNYFKDNFIIVDNSGGLDNKESTLIYKKIMKFAKSPHKNPIAKKWIKDQLNESSDFDFSKMSEKDRLEMLKLLNKTMKLGVKGTKSWKEARKKINDLYRKYGAEFTSEDNLNEEKEVKAVRTKSKETGIDYKILKQVFDRGVAAWRTGHRPGTTPAQWGLARINSFVTGGKTQTTADKDLAKKAGLVKENWAELKFKEVYLNRFKKHGEKFDSIIHENNKYKTKDEILYILEEVGKEHNSKYRVFKNLNNQIVFKKI